MKFAAKICQFITFKSIHSTYSCLQSFPPKKHENLTKLDVLDSITGAEKGVGGGERKVGKNTVQNGVGT